MSNSLMSSAQTSSKARIVRVVGKIKVVRSSKQRQTCAESIFQERQVNIRIRAALGHLSEKNSLYNKILTLKLIQAWLFCFLFGPFFPF